MKTKFIDRGDMRKDVKLLILLMLLITVLFVKQGRAQGVDEVNLVAEDSILSLQAENIKTHKRAFFVIGQTVSYKLRSSKHFEKGRITGITDSTISFQKKRIGNNSFKHKDLSAFKIRRSAGRRFAGSFLTFLGGASLVLAGVSAAAPEVDSYGDPAGCGCSAFLVGIGLPLLAGGIALLSHKIIDLEKTWTLQTTKAILPGNIITVILKNGELIKQVKVTGIHPKTIVGIQSVNNRWVKKTIVINDVVKCWRAGN